LRLAPSAVPQGDFAEPGYGRRARHAEWLVLSCYLLGALALTWRLWVDPASRAQVGDSQDVDLYTWFLRYAATAVARGQLPALVTTAMNAPRGIGLMWNTSVLLPGALLTPVTLLAGPQVSATVMLTAGFAGSAASLFFVLRWWGATVVAAALGGVLYGFSPALLNSAAGHYQMQFAVLPPLIIHALLTVVVRSGSPVRSGVLLGVLTAAQVFIGEEMLVQTALAGLILVAVLAAGQPRAVLSRIRPAATGLATAAVVALLCSGYALWVQLRGPLTEHGSPWTTSDFISRPAAFVTPSGGLLFHTLASARTAASYPNFLPEYLAYLGWPLLAVLLLATLCYWRHRQIRATAVTFAALELFSLGGSARLFGGRYPVTLLPWHWLQGLPALSQMLPDRFAVLADGAAAALLAFALDQARSAAPLGPAFVRRGVPTAIAALAIMPIIPLPLQTAAVTPLPGGWQAAFAGLHVAPDARVLVVPVPCGAYPQALRWQATSGEPGSLIGGYFIGPNLKGQAVVVGYPGTSPPGYLNALWQGQKPPDPPSSATVRATLSGWWRPAAVVAVTPARSRLGRFLTRLLGRPAVKAGAVLGWRLHA